MSASSTRDFVRNQGPIVLFVILTLVGSAVIWFGKIWDIDIAVITGIPVAMMFLYLAVNMLPGLRVASEQAGDNLYYMGFIFTLTSLGVSLFKFSGQASIEDVVRNFGIAIVSTVTGIALRIFFNQMRRDPADIEKAVRHELAEMTRRVRAELDNSAMEFSTYRRTSNQMLSEGFEEIARQAEKNGEAVRAAIEAMSAKAVESIDGTSKQLLSTLQESHANVAQLAESNGRNVAELSAQMATVADSMSEKSKQLSSAIDIVIEKYASARSPDEVLRVDVAPAVETLRALLEAHATTIRENSADTKEITKRVLAGVAPFKQAATNLTKLTSEVQAATAIQTKSSETINELASAIRDAVSASNTAYDAHAANATKIAELVTAANARHTEAKTAEEQSRIRDERIEHAILRAGSPSFAVVPTASSVPETPQDSGEAIVVNPAVQDEERPRRSWWQR